MRIQALGNDPGQGQASSFLRIDSILEIELYLNRIDRAQDQRSLRSLFILYRSWERLFTASSSSFPPHQASLGAADGAALGP